jgi:hypothetical protein
MQSLPTGEIRMDVRFQHWPTHRKETHMETKVNSKAMAERLNGGRFFRLMLREVRPEHVPDMLHMLWLFRHGGKKLAVPEEGPWLMKMPHDYVLLGEGRVGVRIEPTRGLVAPQAINPYNGDHFKASQSTVPIRKLDEHDTQGVLALCEQARKTSRPERDRIISQIFALRLDRCRPTALDAVELLIYDLITSKTQ